MDEQALYDVRGDPVRRMLRVVLRGYWDAAVMAAYKRAVRAELDRMSRSGGCDLVLIDMLDFAIQSQEIAAAHARLLAGARDVMGLRTALVMQSGLSRLQARRVAASTGDRTFATEDEALAWLEAGAATG